MALPFRPIRSHHTRSRPWMHWDLEVNRGANRSACPPFSILEDTSGIRRGNGVDEAQIADLEIGVPRSVAGGRGFADFSPCGSGRQWIERHFGGIGIAGWQPLPADSCIGRRAHPPHLLNYHTLRYPTIPALKDQTGNRSRPALETGEDHTRVGCHGTCSKVSRRSHLSVTSVRLNGSGSSIPS